MCACFEAGDDRGKKCGVAVGGGEVEEGGEEGVELG